jgi:hypothetical protein
MRRASLSNANLSDFELKTPRRLSGRAELSYRQIRQPRPLPGLWTDIGTSSDVISSRVPARPLRQLPDSDVGRGAKAPHIA